MGDLNSHELSEDKSANLNSHEFPEDNSVNDRYKIIFVGDSGVGKKEIMNHIRDKSLNESYEPSIGVDFMSKNIKFRGQNIKLQMWDTPGQEKNKSLIPYYVRNSSIVFLVYDISSRMSFYNIPKWINFIKSIENTKLVLCGNKIDLNSREVSKEEGVILAKKESVDFFEVNSETGENIKNMFYNVIADLPSFTKANVDKENLVKELLNENEFKNEKGGTNNATTDCGVENQMDVNIVSDKF